MTLRAALVFIVLGFTGLLLAMGLRSFVEWLKRAYPRRFRMILAALAVLVTSAIVWIVFELMERPAFRPNDLITLHEPVVANTVAVDRDSRTTACIVDNSEHLAVVGTEGGTMTARVESNNRSASVYCAIGSEVRIELAWLRRYSLTHR
jgi:Na+/melibiose symporter-like transporter